MTSGTHDSDNLNHQLSRFVTPKYTSGDTVVGATCCTGTCATGDTGVGATVKVGSEFHDLDFQTKMPDKHNQKFCLEFEVLCGKLRNSHDVHVTLHHMLKEANAKFLKDFANFNINFWLK